MYSRRHEPVMLLSLLLKISPTQGETLWCHWEVRGDFIMGSLIRRASLLYLSLLSHGYGISHLGVLSYLSVRWADSLMFRSCCQVPDHKGASHEYASNLNGERGAWVQCLVTLFG